MESAVIISGQEITQLLEKLNQAIDALAKPRAQEKDFVGNEEFMKLMGISKRTAQTWRDDGIISFSQVGGKIYYSQADIQKILKKHRHEAF